MKHTTADLSPRHSSVGGAPSPAASAPLVAEPVDEGTATASDAIAPSGSVLPALPVEVIQRILRYTFVPSAPLTPFSDPHHLRGTTHVLRVSRAIRQLALPFVYHTIIISRPLDYVTFFDPEHGLLVASEDGKRRWSLVREIGIVAGVYPDLAPVARGTDYLVPLRIPPDGNIRLACMLDLGPSLAPPVTQDPAEIRRFIRNSPALIAGFSLDAEGDQSLLFHNIIYARLAEIRKQRFQHLHRLLVSDALCELRMTSPVVDHFHFFSGAYQPTLLPTLRYLITLFHSSSDGKKLREASVVSIILRLRRLGWSLGEIPAIRLGGFPPDMLDEFRKHFERTIADQARVPRDRTWEPEWVWSWRGADGSDVQLVPPSMTSDTTWHDNLARADAALLDEA